MVVAPEAKLVLAGTTIRQLQPHDDHRGSFLELFRDEWNTGCEPRQWNVVRNNAGVLRGVHVHACHTDYLTLVSGVMMLGLHDLRTWSNSAGKSVMLTIEAERPISITIPPGVCHGFYFPEPSMHVYAVSEYWNKLDELGCRFDCPELGLAWPDADPMLSERDKTAGDFPQMQDAFARAEASLKGKHRAAS